MIEIHGKLISLEIIEKQFVCNLNACKGACCIEGDEGAPLDPNEILELEQNIQEIIPYLDEEGQAIVRSRIYEKRPLHKTVTPLKENGACVYSNKDKDGILYCGIEKAWQHGKSSFLKPISCHLYPIRISKNEEEDWEALNYSEWDICNPACKLGQSLKVPVYQFLKNAIQRKYGVDFYKDLDAIATDWNNK